MNSRYHENNFILEKFIIREIVNSQIIDISKIKLFFLNL